MRLVSVLAIAAATFAAAPAYAQAYETGTVTFTGLGDQIGSGFDQLTLGGIVGNINTIPGIYLINNVSFLAGVNTNSTSTYTDTGVFTNSLMLGGSSYTYTVPYAITISTTDSITLFGSTQTFGGYTFVFNSLTLTSGGAPASTGIFSANVSLAPTVPEPATWAMMLAGFGMVGVGLRARRKQTVRVTYA